MVNITINGNGGGGVGGGGGDSDWVCVKGWAGITSDQWVVI